MSLSRRQSRGKGRRQPENRHIKTTRADHDLHHAPHQETPPRREPTTPSKTPAFPNRHGADAYPCPSQIKPRPQKPARFSSNWKSVPADPTTSRRDDPDDGEQITTLSSRPAATLGGSPHTLCCGNVRRGAWASTNTNKTLLATADLTGGNVQLRSGTDHVPLNGVLLPHIAKDRLKRFARRGRQWLAATWLTGGNLTAISDCLKRV
ncbi:hypothetical protein CCHR01_18730 [Colletotrichum chrysophilum]|uniref:Uncharacterized protein n=1 Tax=Colletotrichum chrysophilum TaxID=1836956 RepID=A0AAD9A047_9PEZI|nr:hypothetical protein CCHR01_18730 [Colletotrichum chrysophilum]